MEMSFSSPFRQIEQGWLAGASGPFHERLSTHSWTLFFGILWEEKRDVSLPFPWLKSPASERAIASADDEYTHTFSARYQSPPSPEKIKKPTNKESWTESRLHFIPIVKRRVARFVWNPLTSRCINHCWIMKAIINISGTSVQFYI